MNKQAQGIVYNCNIFSINFQQFYTIEKNDVQNMLQRKQRQKNNRKYRHKVSLSRSYSNQNSQISEMIKKNTCKQRNIQSTKKNKPIPVNYDYSDYSFDKENNRTTLPISQKPELNWYRDSQKISQSNQINSFKQNKQVSCSRQSHKIMSSKPKRKSIELWKKASKQTEIINQTNQSKNKASETIETSPEIDKGSLLSQNSSVKFIHNQSEHKQLTKKWRNKKFKQQEQQLQQFRQIDGLQNSQVQSPKYSQNWLKNNKKQVSIDLQCNQKASNQNSSKLFTATFPHPQMDKAYQNGLRSIFQINKRKENGHKNDKKASLKQINKHLLSITPKEKHNQKQSKDSSDQLIKNKNFLWASEACGLQSGSTSMNEVQRNRNFKTFSDLKFKTADSQGQKTSSNHISLALSSQQFQDSVYNRDSHLLDKQQNTLFQKLKLVTQKDIGNFHSASFTFPSKKM